MGIDLSKYKGWEVDYLLTTNNDVYKKKRKGKGAITLSISKVYGGKEDSYHAHAYYWDKRGSLRGMMSEHTKTKGSAEKKAEAFMRSH